MEIQDHIIFKQSYTQPLPKSGTYTSNNKHSNTNNKNSNVISTDKPALIPRSPPVHKLEKIGEANLIENSVQDIEELLEKSHKTIIRISSVFPFEFFPSTVDVEENKVTVIFRQMFGCYQMQSIDIQDISNVNVQSSIFFANLKISTRHFIENNVQVRWLKKKEAISVRNIIEGLREIWRQRRNLAPMNYQL